MRTLVLGGARSGKSVFAENLAGPGSVLYVATARPWPEDNDFGQRIAEHVARRPSTWTTNDTADAVTLLRDPPPHTVLVDDLGTWLTHATDEVGQHAWEEETSELNERIEQLIAMVKEYRGGDLLLVSPEVGLSVIPEHRSGRLFRDRIGTINQELAQVCEKVVLLVAGLPLELKTI